MRTAAISFLVLGLIALVIVIFFAIAIYHIIINDSSDLILFSIFTFIVVKKLDKLVQRQLNIGEDYVN